MKNEIDFRLILDAYEKIHEHGEARQGQHLLEGIKAFTDHDGYTVFLEGQGVKLRLEFHNKYHLDYDNGSQLDKFIRALKSISEGYQTPGLERG
ncbi:DUF3081 domain-containing protein [Idiomarina seosinensis]|uniref:DUF3081 domain-containing protein n=1 Tax=Idiomarina seosinensis TaxID=281739 RepID=UPI00384C081C